MRSPADGRAAPQRTEHARVALEWALRALALVAIALLLWRALRRPAPRAASHALVPAAVMHVATRDSTRVGDTLDVEVASAPSATERAVLAALAATGRVVRWRDAGVPALAVAVEPARTPDGAPRLLALAPPGTSLALGDDAGMLDSLRGDGRAIALGMPGAGRGLVGRSGASAARASLRESVAVRRVLVLARAGWEAKFTVAALEEAGWRVDAALQVAPTTRVSQGDAQAATADTARHAGVVILDSASAALHATSVARYVRAGGGLVLAGDAAAAPAMASLRPGRVGPRTAGEAGALATARARSGLPLRATIPAPDAVVLERRGTLVAAAARRVGTGRVLQLGYEDSWRWRMEGDDRAAAEHRRWWSAVVGSVAYTPVIARLGTSMDAEGALDPAPRAALVAALGASREARARAADPARPARSPDSLLFATALVALLCEWASRRLRGAR